MSGAFNYPREEHHVVLNVHDEVDVNWWSTFANQLFISCHEGIDKSNIWTYSYTITKNGTRAFSPLQLERQFTDWSLPAGCALTLSEVGKGAIAGATLGVTSVATQPASILAQLSTVAFSTSSVSSASSSSATSSSSLNTSIASATASPSSTVSTPTVSATAEVNSNDGLSKGAKIGVGLGVALGAVLIAAAAFLFYRNHRKVKILEDRLSYQPQTTEWTKPVGVSVGHDGNAQYQQSYSDADTWSHMHQSPPLAPPQELETVRK